MKRTTRMCMAAAMVLSLLTGCGSSPAPEQDAQTGEGNTQNNSQENLGAAENQGAEDTVEAAENGEVVELNYYTWIGSADKDSYPNNMIAAFQEKYPNIKINVEYGSQNVDEYLQMQKVKLLSGKNLDITTLRAESRQPYVEAGYLLGKC